MCIRFRCIEGIPIRTYVSKSVLILIVISYMCKKQTTTSWCANFLLFCVMCADLKMIFLTRTMFYKF